MSGKNSEVRKELERIYGRGCFFSRAHCAERIEKMGGIKTFKKFEEEKKFRGKKISHQITFHHLKHRSERRKDHNRKWSKCRRNSSSIFTQFT